MSSQLSVFDQFTFNKTQLFVVSINGREWSRAKEICQALEYNKKAKDVIRAHCSIANKRHRYELKGGSESELTSNSQPGEYYINEESLYELLFTSQQPKAKMFRKFCFRMFPRIRQQLTEKIKQDHKQTIEEKDSALALLNDDLEDSQRKIVVLEQDNVELQNQVQTLQRCAVPYLEDSKKDNGLVVIQKNNEDREYSYVVICVQQGYVVQKIQHMLIDYPNGQIVVLVETSNAIVHYNFLRERGCIAANPERPQYFRLGENYTHQRLMGLEEA